MKNNFISSKIIRIFSLILFLSLTPAWLFGQCGPFTKISSGSEHTLAIKNDGTLWVWGYNNSGQLGNGSQNASLVPIQIGTSNNWVEISTFISSSFAINNLGELYAWGYNSFSNLGLGPSFRFVNNVLTPTLVGSGYSKVAAGATHTLAIKTDGTLWSWGDGFLGGGGNYRNLPAQIGVGLGTWNKIAAGDDHSLAINTNGKLYAFGENGNGQLGIGSTTDASSLTQVGSAKNWTEIKAGYNHSIAIKSGQLWSWGRNNNGQLGLNNLTDFTSPKRIGSASNWTQISAGYQHNIAKNSLHQIFTWGNNGYGQLGDGTTVKKSSLVNVTGGLTYTDIFAGGERTFGILSNGSLRAAGGLLGNGTTSSSVFIPICGKPPVLTTASPASITSNAALLGGNVLDSGQTATSERGIVYSTSPNPTTSHTKVQIGNGLGAFSQNITGLSSNTKYYVRAYAINGDGTGYGIVDSFTTNTSVDPIISTVGSLAAFNACSGFESKMDSFTVSGTNLTTSIDISAPTGFEISSDLAFGFNSSLSLTQITGLVSSTKIYVRLNSSASGTPSGNIVLSSTGATTQNVAASGTVNAVPTINLGAVNSVLISATSFSLPYSGTTGSPNQYSIETGTPNAMPSFAAVNNATLGSSPISIAIPASASNTYNFNLTVKNSTTGCNSSVLPFALTVGNPQSTISVTGAPSAFTSCSGSPSAVDSISVSGSFLTANLTITAPIDFEVSSTLGTGYGSSVSLAPSNGTVASTTIYVRLTSSASGIPSGNIICASTGATTINVAASGTVSANPAPIAPTLGSNYSGTYDGFAHLPTVTVGVGETAVWYTTMGGATSSTGLTNVTATTTLYAAARITATGCESSSRTSGDVTISPKALTITAVNQAKCEGSNFTFEGTEFISSGLVNSDTLSSVTITCGASGIGGTNAGSPYTIEPSAAIGSGLSNYSINYVNGSFTVWSNPIASYTVTETSGGANNDNNICSGATVTFNGSASSFGTGASSLTYQWKRDGINAPGLDATNAIYAPVVTGINNPDQFVYHLVVTNNHGCTSTPFLPVTNTTINIYPSATPSITTPVVGTQGNYGVPGNNGNGGQLLCHSNVIFGNTTILPAGGSTVVYYIWSFGDSSSNYVVTTTDNVKHEYPVNRNINWFDPAFPNTRYTVSLTAITNQGCSITSTINRDVKNGPDAIIGLNDPTTQNLVGNSYAFANKSDNNHPSFIGSSIWDWGDGTGTGSTTFIPKVYTAAGSYRVHLINYTGTGCTDTAYLDLTVSSPVAASFTTTPNTCGSKVVGFTSTSSGATSYSWNFGDGSPADLTANPSHTYAADGAYIVILTINGAIASAPTTIYVVSNPVVGAIVNGGTSACGNTYSFSNVSTGLNLSYAWTFGGAASTGETSTTSTASRIYSVAGAATVDLIVSADGRCPVSATQLGFTSVIGGGSPVAGLSIAAASAPSATSKSVNNTSTNGSLYYVSLDGAAFVAKTVFPYDIISLTNGSHTVRLVASDLLGTCKDTATTTFTITSTPCAAVAGINTTPSTTQTLATNRFDFFNTTTVSGFGWISANSWDFGDGTTSTNTHIYGKSYAAAGTYTVTLVATKSPGGCTSTATQIVTVTAPAAATFTTTPNTCGSKVVGFTSTSSGATSYSWNFGDGSPADLTANPFHTYAADGAYIVTLTINGAIASTPTTIYVVSNPVVGAIVNGGPGLCGNSYTFSNISTGFNLSYAWTFDGAASTGTTSTTSSATRIYSAAGAATVDLIVSADGRCPVSATQLAFTSVVGTTRPIASLGNGPASVPSPTSVAITNSSTNASLFAISIDGAAFVTQLTYPYDLTGLTNGSHSVRLVAADIGWTCKDTATTTFTITTTPCVAVAGFNITPTSTQPLATNKFDFFNTTTHNGFGWVTSYSWDFGDGTTNGVNTFVYGKTYASSGTYNVTLTAVSSTGCTSTATKVVTVSASATSSFSYTQPSCGVLIVPFDGSASTSASTYSWNFGDGSPAATTVSPTHTYAAAGSYTVVLTINGTTASAPQTLVVGSAPTAVTITPTLNTCGNIYTYTAASTGGVTYSWSFSNLNGTGATTGAVVTRTYSAAGTENVILTASSSLCTATATLNSHSVLQASTLIDANLIVTASNSCNGTRTINNTGSVGTVYEVSVDGGAYVVKTTFPYDVTGLAVGAHSISLKASTGLCFDIATEVFNVGSVTAAFTSSSSSCGPTVAFTNTSTSTYGTPTYSWNFNSGESTSTATSPSYTFLTAGSKTVTLTATLPNGCVGTSTNAAVVANPGSGALTASFTSLMVVSGSCNTGVQFTSTSTGATSYVWNYGDGTVSVPSTTTGIFHAYSATGTFVVTLTAYGQCGQTSTATANVVVTATGNPVPEVSFSSDNATQCITGNRYDFFNRTQLNGAGWVPTYSWNFGDGTTNNVNTFIYGKTYAAAGTYTVTLTGTSNLGCSSSSSMTITVSALPCSPMIYTPEKGRGNHDGGTIDKTIGSISTTGINKSPKDIFDEISLYPNPNNGAFTLGFKDLSSNSVNILIIDMLGREVYINNFVLNGKKEIDLNEMNLSAGTYSLVLKGDDDSYARKNFVVLAK